MATQEAIRTMVVDDSPVALRAMCSVVARQKRLSFVGSATNGKEAVELARGVQPDLVLLDLEMPMMDGLETTTRLRRECPATRVVVVTVHDTAEMRKLCKERGACAFVAKEMMNDELPKIIKKLFTA